MTEPVKPNLNNVSKPVVNAAPAVQPVVGSTKPADDLDDATKARLQAAEKAKLSTQTGKLNIQ